MKLQTGFTIIKSAVLFWGISLLFYGCNTDEAPRPQVEITSFTLEGVGEFRFSNDNILLLDSGRKYRMTILTDPGDAVVEFSLDNRGLAPLTELPEINSDIREITFIAGKSNYRQSNPITLRIDALGQSLKGFDISPTPVNDSLHLRSDNKTRGAMHLTVFTMHGKILLKKSLLKQQDNFHFVTDVSSFVPGIYLVHLEMGSAEETFKFLVK